MLKYIFVFFLTISIIEIQASTKVLDTKINLNKKILKNKKLQKSITNLKIKSLALSIKKEKDIYNKIQYNIKKVSNIILLNKLKLQKAKKNIQILRNKQFN